MLSSLFSERLLVTLWVGSLLAIGYIAVPMAFVSLGDVALAGNYAGKLFSVVSLLGLGCGTILLIGKTLVYGRQVLTLWRVWLILLMLVLTLIFSVYLQPEIVIAKQLIGLGNNTVVARFDTLHAISESLYLFLSLLGLALVVSTDKQISEVRA